MLGLPEEITVGILKRLPIKSVLKFRCVCKKWYNILNDPEFLKKQQNHDLGDDDSTLILRKGRDYYSISNDTFTSISSSSSSDVAISLSAKDVKDLDFPIISPKTPMPFTEETVQILGSCYDSKINDYKLVRIAKSDENVPEVKVYTQIIVFKHLRVIVSFDLGSETFKELALPENLRGGANVCFSAAGGCLAVLCSDPCPWGQFDVWVMKDYRRRESWTRLFTITENIKSFEYIIRSFRHLRQMVCLKNGEFLLEFGLEAESRADLVVYDPKTERARVLNVPKKRGYTKPRLCDVLLFRVETYIESLVSLNSGTYVG
ncbi:F-box protein CPR1-like [Papaver somniferum]|uniref:F-box protein CPR1-like n=1 Tax=Papaver somniferum TaxID=3469 RepID=UPI000E7053C5|nr:F-box protein CPR1-like [Papaver somniferum]